MHKKIALCLQGISYSKDYTNIPVNYKTCIDSIKKNLIKVLEKNNLKVDLFLNTYESEVKEDLLSDYKPINCKFIPFAHRQNYVLENLKNSCELLLSQINFLEEYDFVVITRFDCYFYQPIDMNRINFDVINYCWLGEDNFFFLPANMLSKFKYAVETCPEGYAGAHGLYVGIQDMGYSYNSMYSHEELANFQKTFPDTRCFYTIHRYIEKIPQSLLVWNE